MISDIFPIHVEGRQNCTVLRIHIFQALPASHWHLNILGNRQSYQTSDCLHGQGQRLIWLDLGVKLIFLQTLSETFWRLQNKLSFGEKMCHHVTIVWNKIKGWLPMSFSPGGVRIPESVWRLAIYIYKWVSENMPVTLLHCWWDGKSVVCEVALLLQLLFLVFKDLVFFIAASRFSLHSSAFCLRYRINKWCQNQSTITAW